MLARQKEISTIGPTVETCLNVKQKKKKKS